ncbi:Sugar transporter [Dermatophagoides farinae]|uniref:Sugar transporter n=1 Tax=Dermatophagoides farinae TaxID=6954 RepID=A0A922L385_DERFA|nr:Sugar transporter [Dermatophagoides farinae]
MKFEDILQQIGDENRFQNFLIIFLLLPTSFFNVFFEGMFLLSTPDHWCRVPELEHLSMEHQQHLIRPIDPITGKRSNCERYDVEYKDFLNTINTNNNNNNDLHQDIKLLISNSTIQTFAKIQCNNGWIYDQSLYTETAVTWFNFVCNRDYYVNLIMSLTAIGLAVLTPLLSNLSDSIGRKKAMLITMIIAQISCLSPIIFKDIYSFLIARFLAGGILCVYYQLPFVITQELVSQKYRTLASSLSAIFYSLGSCSLTLALKLTGNWVTFTWVQFIFTSFLIIAYKLIPESPSWLISKKRYDEAYEQLAQVCRFNKRKVPDDLMANIMSLESDEDELKSTTTTTTKITEINNDNENEDSFFDLILMPGLRSKTLIITIVFIACIIGYGGIIGNTVNMEANNQLYNYLLLSFIDLPSLFICWKLINTRLGRRWTNVITMGICGIALILPAIFNRQYDEYFYTGCTLVGKFGVAGTFMIIYQHSSELYPTTLRNQGLGLTATIGSIGAILTPQIVYIAKYGEWIPLFIIGILCLLASIIASFLPETLNEYLPQCSREAANFGRDKKFFTMADLKNRKLSITKKTTTISINNDDDGEKQKQQQQTSPKTLMKIFSNKNSNDYNSNCNHQNNNNNNNYYYYHTSNNTTTIITPIIII